ncbi:hypothetical protein NDU88_004824 [Pleurodeles waltl]|uniref:Uncharacterized protein n=1 Tax=Pleurodeles waltl TaxID=8319 RepID=A0AAV7PDL1_PLEWA|nr:hypothetical protein NDU88_004824 [Pleurodeles waltl]
MAGAFRFGSGGASRRTPAQRASPERPRTGPACCAVGKTSGAAGPPRRARGAPRPERGRPERAEACGPPPLQSRSPALETGHGGRGESGQRDTGESAEPRVWAAGPGDTVGAPVDPLRPSLKIMFTSK